MKKRENRNIFIVVIKLQNDRITMMILGGRAERGYFTHLHIGYDRQVELQYYSINAIELIELLNAI